MPICMQCADFGCHWSYYIHLQCTCTCGYVNILSVVYVYVHVYMYSACSSMASTFGVEVENLKCWFS